MIPKSLVEDTRCRIFWGESCGEILTYLKGKGVEEADAKTLVNALTIERAQSIRADGVKKTMTGIFLLSVPIVYYLTCLWLTFVSLAALYVTMSVGALGLFKISKGIWMVLKARSIQGDASDMEGWI